LYEISYDLILAHHDAVGGRPHHHWQQPQTMAYDDHTLARRKHGTLYINAASDIL
jgi:hypothetical protein